MRKFAKTLAVMGILTPVGVNALGVGEVQLHSALNQRLLAEISLLISAREDISQIRVHLASPEAFAKAGLNRPYFLANLRFQPIRKADGSVVIQVTSTDVIREPFLDFLLEVEWPQGRMLREFTVLLDPPVTYDDTVTVVQTPPPGVTPQSVQQRRSVATVADGNLVEYGPVRRNESLWKIAEKLKPDASITIEQMMMALYRQNPHAFLNKNINALKMGVTLKIPSRDVIMQLSPRQARREFQQQYRMWIARRRVTEPETQSPLPEDIKEAAKPQLKLVPPVATSVDSKAGVPQPKAPALTELQTVKMIEELRAENEALRARIESLEKRITVLLEAKGPALAAAQEKQAPISAPVGQEGQQPEVQVPPASQIAAVNSSVPPAAEDKPESRTEQAQTRLQPEPKPKPKARPKPAVTTGESGFLGSLFDEPVYLSLAGGSLFLLGVAGWMIWRRRQAAAEQADSLLSDMDLSTLEVEKPGTEAEPAEQVGVSSTGVEVAEASFLSEFTPSDFDILETENEAVDPLAEADVYLAYGRYQQAEELIKQALEEDPEDPALRLKLLEIYYANEDKVGFEKYATELHAAGAHRDIEFWSKVVEMAREMGLDAAIFSIEEADAGSETDPESSAGTSLDLVNFDDPSKDGAESDRAGATEALGADFDLPGGSDSSLEISGEAPITEETDDAWKLDLDLSDLKLQPEGQGPETSVAQGDDTLEFSLSVDSPDSREIGGRSPVEEEGDFELTTMDDMDTKLDLARAYADMEDVDSAKDILEDVLAHGNARQKQEAQELLNKIEMTSS